MKLAFYGLRKYRITRRGGGETHEVAIPADLVKALPWKPGEDLVEVWGDPEEGIVVLMRARQHAVEARPKAPPMEEAAGG